MKRKVGRRNAKPDFRVTEQFAAVTEGPQRKKKWTKHDIKPIRPLTDNQTNLFTLFFQGEHLLAEGTAGTGKSFLSCYLGICDVIDPDHDQDKIIIVRSAVQTRDQGFMPGTLEEKAAYYELPYKQIFGELFNRAATYDDMKEAGLIEFMTTSFIRGLTWDNAIIIVDEVQNMTFDEINTVMTRVGKNSRILVCGDIPQNDLTKNSRDVSGMEKMRRVLKRMKGFSSVQFTTEDIVRGPFVKAWITAVEATD